MSKWPGAARLRAVTGTLPVRDPEGIPMTTSSLTATATAPTRIGVAVRADADAVWNALTDGAVTPAYYYGFTAEIPQQVGQNYRYTAGGGDMITGRVLAVEPGRSLSMTFSGHWAPDVAALPESTVHFTLTDPPMPLPGVTVLTCVHEGLPQGVTASHLEAGWVTILSGLKTLLETGTPLATPPQ